MEPKDWKAKISSGDLSKFEIEELIERETDSIDTECIAFVGFNDLYEKVGVRIHFEDDQDSILKCLLELISLDSSCLAVFRFSTKKNEEPFVKKEILISNIINEITQSVGLKMDCYLRIILVGKLKFRLKPDIFKKKFVLLILDKETLSISKPQNHEIDTTIVTRTDKHRRKITQTKKGNSAMKPIKSTADKYTTQRVG
jgi:hypothetical protein